MAADPRPMFTPRQATEVTQQLYGVTVRKLTTLPSYMDQNFLVEDGEGCKYVLKIMNSKDSEDAALLGIQTLAMSFLHQHGLPAQTVLSTTAGKLMSMVEIDCGHGAQTYCVRLLTYLHGETVAKSPVTNQDLYDVGKMAATLNKTLLQLPSPDLDVLQRDDVLWHMENVPVVMGYLSVMDGDPLQDMIRSIIQQFQSYVQPKMSNFQKGIIHADLSDQNIIVIPSNDGHHEVSGILDFSMLMTGCHVYDLAIMIMYMMLESASPMEVGGALLAGWESVMLLNDDERDCLFLMVLGRLCQSLVYGRHNVSKYPDNKEYLLTTAESGTRILHKLVELGQKEVERKWFTDARMFKQ